MHLNVPWSWIVGVVAAAIVIASLVAARRRTAPHMTIPGAELDESGSFPVLMPPEEPAEILMPPGREGAAEREPVIADVASEVPAGLPPIAEPPEDELDEALDDALDRVVK